MMKTIPLSGRELSAIVVLAALVVLGTASGQDPNGNDGGGNVLLPWPGSDVSMDSRNVTEEGEGRHEIVVTYSNATGVQRESLGDGDLLVVSRNGYLQEAALVSVVELPIEVDPWGIVDPATGEPIVDPNVDLGLVIDPNIIFPPRWNSIVATYAVTPGSGERWTQADNGGYAVLLQRGEVLWEAGAAVPAQLLGYFDVRIGVDPPEPVLPVRAMVEIEALPTPGAPGGNTLDAYFANVKVWYSGREVRVDWDGVVREGNTFIGRVSATAVPGVDGGGIIGQPDVLEEYGHVFDLGLLGRGDYRFLLKSGGETIARAGFLVDEGPPRPILPDEVGIEIVELPNLGPLPAFAAEVRVAYERDGLAVRWGEMRRDGNVFYGNVEAVVRTADEPMNQPDRAVWENRYSLGMLRQGEYVFVLRSGGEVVGRKAFRVGEVVAGPVVPDAAEIRVAALPMIAIFPPPPPRWGAEVFLRFENPVGVVVESWGEVKREGRRLWVDVEAGRRAGDGDDLPPLEAFRHDYFIGQLEGGEYTFTVLSRGQRIAVQTVVVEGDGGGPEVPEGRVQLEVDASNPVTVSAAVWLEDSTWLIEAPGAVSRERNVFYIDVSARRVRPVENEGDIAKFSYDFGELERGGYVVVYRINGKVFSREEFRVDGEVEPAVPIIRDIVISEGDAAHFAEVSVVLPEPNLVVLDWGEVRRERNQFLVAIVTGRADAADGEGDEVPVIGVPGQFPVRLVSHSYVLGVLERGEYLFGVTHRGRTIAREGFVVRRGEGDPEPPEVEVVAEDIKTAAEQPQRFRIVYSDRSGLADLEAITGQVVTVTGGRGDVLVAEMVEFFNTEDEPPTAATAVYEVGGPGNDWGVDDRGRYRISLSDPGAIQDTHGNALRGATVGGFSVMIWPEPVEPPRKGEIVLRQGDAGDCEGTVHLRVPENIAVRDDWEVNWGELSLRGNAFVAKAEFLRAGQVVDGEEGEREPWAGPDDGIAGGNPFEAELRQTPADAPGQLISHTYQIGALRPGGYLFVAVSNIGHFLKEEFEVEGDGLDLNGERGEDGLEPAVEVIALWRGAAFEDGQWLFAPGVTGDGGNADGGVLNNLLEYSAGTDPSDPGDDWKGVARPEIIDGADGKQHFGIRFRRIIPGLDLRYRIEGSRDMKGWEDVEASIEMVEEHASLDGIEEVLACLREGVDEGEFRWLRVVVERD